jgi:hypothetical protein
LSLKRAAGEAVKWFTGGKWDPNKTAKEAYVDFLSKMGNIGEDRDIIEQIGDKDKIEFDGQVSKIVLSRSNIGKYRENFERVDSNMNLLNYLKEVREWNKNIHDPEITELEGKLALIIKQCSMETVGFSMPGLDDVQNLILDKPIMFSNSNNNGPIPQGVPPGWTPNKPESED